MKKSIKWIALLCMAALLLQGCGASANHNKNNTPTDDQEKPKDEGPTTVQVTMTEEELYDKLVGGWIGQMVGVAWAASTEFVYAGELMSESRMPTWTPDMINSAFGQDDLYVEIPFLDAMRENGANCDPSYLAEKFRDSKFALWHANGMGRENLLNGIGYPNSGSYLYNYHADDIDWQIEADFLGMMYPGMVNAAAERAFELGHIMNYGDGVYGGVFVSAMHAAAFTAGSVEEICQAGIESIPEGTQFRMLVDDVMASYKAGDSFEKNWRMLEEKWAPTDICPELPGVSNIDAKLNSGYILLGLLYGNGDMDKTIILSTRCGQDSDCNPSSAASILGNYYGYSKLPENYKSGLNRTGIKFSNTNYNFDETIELNLALTKEILLTSGAKLENATWTINKDVKYTPVKFEQWPDGVFGYLNLKISGNTVQIVELTPYSKNEKVTGYTLDMGDGTVFRDVTPAKYVYAKGGDYTIKLTVTGDKGSKQTVEKKVKASLSSATVLSTIIICDITTPMGGGSKNINVICDGVTPQAGKANDGMQYDTYILGDPHGNPSRSKVSYIGYVYTQKKTVSEIVFTEGNHFGDGGWFESIAVEVLINGKWTAVECTTSPKNYVGGGAAYETFTFTLKEAVSCDGVRLIGYAGGHKTFISVGELTVK